MLETGGARLEQALGIAYRYLNRRERTEAEMRVHLHAKGVDPPVIDLAVGELAEQGYVDDARYARLFANDKRDLESWGSDRIRRVLRERGVEPEVVDAALRSEAAEGELERAVEVLRRRFPAPLADRRERERALGVLLRKGYDSELALEALARHAGTGIDDD